MNNWLVVLMVVFGLILSGCRGEDDVQGDVEQFPATPNPDAFISFLNRKPAVPENRVALEIDNVEDFPEAYYNTIDPLKTRTTFDDWRIANGFLNEDLSESACDASDCEEAHVKFRDVKDLGYGRNMFMRRNLTTGAVAVYVENFNIDVPGLRYGPMNLEALIDNDRAWNFGVNAIEFSVYPQVDADARPFTKFYNFAGDGKQAFLSSGSQQHFVNLDSRGVKPMPTPCIVCHGGRGRTLVYNDADGAKMLAPTITGGIPGDLQANMQTIELDTLQFANIPGFSEDDNADGIRKINDAVLSTFRQRDRTLTDIARRAGDWDPAFAIEIAMGRYGDSPEVAGTPYDDGFVPAGWLTGDTTLYENLIGPNCIVCHALRGSALVPSIAFSSAAEFANYDERVDHLVFEKGLMPLGLLNYVDFWESDSKDPGALAAAIGHPERLVDAQRAVRPGEPVAVIAAPPMAVGLNSANNEIHDIPISGADSAFTEQWRWSVQPEAGASITAIAQGQNGKAAGSAVLRVSDAGVYTITLQVEGPYSGLSDSQSVQIIVQDEAVDALLLPAAEINYYGAGGIDALMSKEGATAPMCKTCHAPDKGYDGIPLHYVPCSSDVIDGHEFVYRSVLARVNFDSPLNSLFLRKPTQGATDPQDRVNSQISGYHNGGYVLSADEDYSTVLSWILNGAPQGDLPQEAIDADAASCI